MAQQQKLEQQIMAHLTTSGTEQKQDDEQKMRRIAKTGEAADIAVSNTPPSTSSSPSSSSSLPSLLFSQQNLLHSTLSTLSQLSSSFHLLQSLYASFRYAERGLRAQLALDRSLAATRKKGLESVVDAILDVLSTALLAERAAIYFLGKNELFGLEPRRERERGEREREVSIGAGGGSSASSSINGNGGFVRDVYRHRRFLRGQFLAGLVAHEGRPVILRRNAWKHPLFDPIPDRVLGQRTRSILCVPVRDEHDEEVLCVVQLANKRMMGRAPPPPPPALPPMTYSNTPSPMAMPPLPPLPQCNISPPPPPLPPSTSTTPSSGMPSPSIHGPSAMESHQTHAAQVHPSSSPNTQPTSPAVPASTLADRKTATSSIASPIPSTQSFISRPALLKLQLQVSGSSDSLSSIASPVPVPVPLPIPEAGRDQSLSTNTNGSDRVSTSQHGVSEEQREVSNGHVTSDTTPATVADSSPSDQANEDTSYGFDDEDDEYNGDGGGQSEEEDGCFSLEDLDLLLSLTSSLSVPLRRFLPEIVLDQFNPGSSSAAGGGADPNEVEDMNGLTAEELVSGLGSIDGAVAQAAAVDSAAAASSSIAGEGGDAIMSGEEGLLMRHHGHVSVAPSPSTSPPPPGECPTSTSDTQQDQVQMDEEVQRGTSGVAVAATGGSRASNTSPGPTSGVPTHPNQSRPPVSFTTPELSPRRFQRDRAAATATATGTGERDSRLDELERQSKRGYHRRNGSTSSSMGGGQGTSIFNAGLNETPSTLPPPSATPASAASFTTPPSRPLPVSSSSSAHAHRSHHQRRTGSQGGSGGAPGQGMQFSMINSGLVSTAASMAAGNTQTSHAAGSNVQQQHPRSDSPMMVPASLPTPSRLYSPQGREGGSAGGIGRFSSIGSHSLVSTPLSSRAVAFGGGAGGNGAAGGGGGAGSFDPHQADQVRSLVHSYAVAETKASWNGGGGGGGGQNSSNTGTGGATSGSGAGGRGSILISNRSVRARTLSYQWPQVGLSPSPSSAGSGSGMGGTGLGLVASQSMNAAIHVSPLQSTLNASSNATGGGGSGNVGAANSNAVSPSQQQQQNASHPLPNSSASSGPASLPSAGGPSPVAGSIHGLVSHPSSTSFSLTLSASTQPSPFPRPFSIDDLHSLSFNVFDYTEPELMRFIVGIFTSMGLIDEFHIAPQTLHAFLSGVRKGYRNNPFHCFVHGFSVMHFAYYTLRHSDAGAHLLPHDVLALLVASLTHDLDHPGNTNAYEIASRSPLALLYNDLHVLEMHHAASTFKLLSNDRANIFANISSADVRAQIRNAIIKAILATDMAEHFGELKKVDEACEKMHTMHQAKLAAAAAAAAQAATTPAAPSPEHGMVHNHSHLQMHHHPLQMHHPDRHATWPSLSSSAPIGVGGAGPLALLSQQSAPSPLPPHPHQQACSTTSTPSAGSPELVPPPPPPQPIRPSLPFDPSESKDRQSLINIIIHSADLSGQVFPTHIARVWEERIAAEFASQAAKETAAGIPVAPFMRNLDSLKVRAKLQANFIEFILTPWWRAVARLLAPTLDTALKLLQRNREYFERMAQALPDETTLSTVTNTTTNTNTNAQPSQSHTPVPQPSTTQSSSNATSPQRPRGGSLLARSATFSGSAPKAAAMVPNPNSNHVTNASNANANANGASETSNATSPSNSSNNSSRSSSLSPAAAAASSSSSSSSTSTTPVATAATVLKTLPLLSPSRVARGVSAGAGVNSGGGNGGVGGVGGSGHVGTLVSTFEDKGVTGNNGGNNNRSRKRSSTEVVRPPHFATRHGGAHGHLHPYPQKTDEELLAEADAAAAEAEAEILLRQSRAGAGAGSGAGAGGQALGQRMEPQHLHASPIQSVVRARLQYVQQQQQQQQQQQASSNVNANGTASAPSISPSSSSSSSSSRPDPIQETSPEKDNSCKQHVQDSKRMETDSDETKVE